jgi:hypothetical protein
MHISQEFTVELVQVAPDGTETPVFPALAQAIASWEREWDDDEEDDDSDEALEVADSDDGEEEESEDAEDDGFLVCEDEATLPDGQLRLLALVSADMLQQFKDLQSSKAQYKLSFVYAGIMRREFDIDNTGYIVLNSGTSSVAPLQVEIYFDVFGGDIKY